MKVTRGDKFTKIVTDRRGVTRVVSRVVLDPLTLGVFYTRKAKRNPNHTCVCYAEWDEWNAWCVGASRSREEKVTLKNEKAAAGSPA